MRVSAPPDLDLSLLAWSTRERPERPAWPAGELLYARIPAPPARPAPASEHGPERDAPSDDVGRVDYDVDFHVR